MLAALIVLATARPDALTGPQLLQDVDVLERAYKALHPGLYRYNSPQRVDRRFDELRGRLRNGATVKQAFLAFSEFAATVRCGHTYVNPFNQTDPVLEEITAGRNRLPFYFKWLGRKMVATSGSLKPGTEVLTLNGSPVGRVLDRLMRIARADGGNDDKRRANLAVQGYGKYEAFDLCYPLYFPSNSESIHMVVREPGSKAERKVDLRCETQAERIAQLAKASEADNPFTFRFLNDRTGYLKMPTWALYNSKWDWKGYLKDTFAKLHEAKANLIVDVRGNEGGQDIGKELLRYVAGAPIEDKGFARFVRARSAPEELRSYLQTWDKSFFDWKENAKEPAFNSMANVELRRMTLWDDPADQPMIQPLEPRLPGKLVVLVDAENSSATFQFAKLVQENRLGTLVGEPTGGSLRGINGGAFFFLNLPNSKIELDLPLVAYLPDRPMPDRGIVPDVRVQETPQSIAKGRDMGLEAAMRVLAG